jgi:hypothetical protein
LITVPTIETTKVVLTATLVLIALAGVLLIGLDAARMILDITLGCPDFTDSQSGGAVMPSWSNFPPGLRCVTTVRLPDGTVGRHTDAPSWGPALAMGAWIGWVATIAWVLQQLRRTTREAQSKPRNEVGARR